MEARGAKVAYIDLLRGVSEWAWRGIAGKGMISLSRRLLLVFNSRRNDRSNKGAGTEIDIGNIVRNRQMIDSA